MRKWIAFSLVAVLVTGFAALPALVTKAQGGTTLPLGEWVEGELTATACTVTYTLSPNAGDLVMVEFLRKTGTMDLDPAMVISDSTGTTLFTVDDTVSGLGAAAIFEADGSEYTITGLTSSIYFNQSDTTEPVTNWDLTCPTDATYGEYAIRASVPELLVPGKSVTATINSDYAQDVSSIFVLRPDAAATWAISFEQPASELRAGIDLMKMPDEETVFSLMDTMGVRSGTLNVDLEAGQIYILVVGQSPYAFMFEETTIDVTISVSEAQ